MANFGNNNFLGNQKRRNFIYNPPVSASRGRNSISAQHGIAKSDALMRISVTRATNETSARSSPHKRLKTSHHLQGIKSGEFAVEDEDALDDQLAALDDEFDDDLLTECDRIASVELQSREKDNSVVASSATNADVNGGLFINDFPSNNDDYNDDDDSLATHCTQEYAVGEISASTTPSKAATYCNGIAEDRVIGSRSLQQPFITHPQESGQVMQQTRQIDLSVKSMDQYVGSSSNSFVPETILDSKSVNETLIHSGNGKRLEMVHNEQLFQSLRKEIDKFKADFLAANDKVKTLEEEKFCRDGEMRILRDSLQHFEAAEKKRQAETKAQEVQRIREQSQREKDLEKQIESLTTQIQFKDREISQMIDRSRKRVSPSTEASSPLQKKSVSMSDVLPTGSSFFQKTSPESKSKSPRSLKTSDKERETLGKQRSQRLSEGENSETSASGGSSGGTSVLKRIRCQQREAHTLERELVQLDTESLAQTELVQNLLLPQDQEQNIPFLDIENDTLTDGSLISLLTRDMPINMSSSSNTRRSAVCTIDPSNTMHLFDTNTVSKLKNSAEDFVEKDSSRKFHSNTLVLQTLNGLLDSRHSENTFLGMTKKTLLSKFKHLHSLASATNFLPLLESHIAHYADYRTENNEENITATCLTRHSPTPDSPDSNDNSWFENDYAKNLGSLQDAALISLRLLNVLVLQSPEVCSCILKSARVFCGFECDPENNDKELNREMNRQQFFPGSEGKESFCQHPLFPRLKLAIRKESDQMLMRLKTEKDTNENNREEENVEHTELLGCLFKLIVPQRKESMTVAYKTLQVLTSLASKCELKYCTRLFPLLSGNLLSEFLTKDWSLTSLSLVTALLTALTRHAEFIKKLCTQSDDCILLKIYQGLLFRPQVPVSRCLEVHLQIVGFVNSLLSHSDSATLLFPLESECQCSLELIKCLVLMLDKLMNSVIQLPSASLSADNFSSLDLMLLRQGVFLLATLGFNDRLFVEHRVDVEHQYINVISNMTRFYKRISGLISEAEVLAVQDLVDFEHIEGIEWSQESDDEADETIEGMDIED
ncbi:ATR-interacting protein-like isoform X2 [Acropora muricata]|uniref:ATR-interacting protein-like isoform X2 n=1 Tax=Acropora muricata TaxID=159855 RepID=UPI0034E4B32F